MKMPFKTGFYIASPFGYRVDPITGEAHVWHGGVDLVGNDLNVRAAVGGTATDFGFVPMTHLLPP